MVGVAQLVRAPDCGSGCRGFESLYPPHKTMRDRECPDPSSLSTQGCRQVVRQGTLTPSSAGSSPAIPATPFRMAPSFLYMCHAPLAQSVEHLPFKQGVRGSNPRRGTKKEMALSCLFFWIPLEIKILGANKHLRAASLAALRQFTFCRGRKRI